MNDIVLILSIVVYTLIGGYIFLQIISNLKDASTSDVLFGVWLFDSNKLNSKGKLYKNILLVNWLLALVMIMGF